MSVLFNRLLPPFSIIISLSDILSLTYLARGLYGRPREPFLLIFARHSCSNSQWEHLPWSVPLGYHDTKRRATAGSPCDHSSENDSLSTSFLQLLRRPARPEAGTSRGGNYFKRAKLSSSYMPTYNNVALTQHKNSKCSMLTRKS